MEATRTRLSQHWHPVAVAADIADAPVRCRLLGSDVVVFRTAAGIHAFKDVCIHRGAVCDLASNRAEELPFRAS